MRIIFIFFYALAVVAVILEWPITVLAISSFIAPKYWLSFWLIFALAFIWDFVWDLLHFYIWKFWKNIHKKIRESKKFGTIIKKIDSYSYFDKLIIIKYTPPITSAWLIYIWASKWDIKEFIKKDGFLCVLSSLVVSIIGYSLWKILWDQTNISYVLLGIGFAFIFLYFLSKYIFKYIIDKINEKNKKLKK